MSARADPTRKPLRFPDFLGIGAQKAGTTWLHKMLESHPDVWVPPLKEIHYFDVLHMGFVKDPATGYTNMDRVRIERAVQAMESAIAGHRAPLEKLRRVQSISLIGLRELTDEWYGTIFQPAAANVPCGEITPEYAMLPPEGIEHILRLQPNIKIIFLLRDPIDRGWSALRMAQRSTNEADEARSLSQIASQDFFRRADYATTIARFVRHLPEHNFLRLYFDDITENPNRLISSVCDFIGVDSQRGKFKKLEKAVNQGEPREMSPHLYEALRARLKPVYEELLKSQNPHVEKWYNKHYPG